MREVSRLLLVVYGSSGVACAYALGLAWLGLAPRLDAAAFRVLAGWTSVATVLAFLFGVPAFYRLTRPIARALDEAAAGRGLNAVHDLAAAQRRCLDLARVLGNTSLGCWLFPLVTLPCCLLSPDSPAPDLLAVVFVGTAGVGLVHATLLMYYAEWVARRKLVPVLLPAGRVSHFAGLRTISVGWKLFFLFASAGFFPTVCFILMHVAGTATLPGALYLAVSTTIFGAVQIVLIIGSIARPIGQLHRAMSRARRGDLSARAEVLSADALGRLSEGFNEMVESLERAEFVRETFGRYVTAEVRDEILRGRVSLGGTRRTATVLFSDIRGFTAWSEGLPPEEVVRFLNHYLDVMVEVLVEHGATIDKFVGDAIVATFGVPVPEEQHALRAVRAALAMLERLPGLSAERAATGAPPLEIGIGINTGEVVAGNIGSQRKMEYTVIGDTVNTASRIEGLCKHFGTRLLVSQATWRLVHDAVVARALPPVEVKGKREPLTVYEVSGLATDAPTVTRVRVDPGR